MRIISLTICHYGFDFLPYALRSVHDFVDAQYVLYTPQGSHGHRTDAVCPDTKDMLIEAAIAGAGDKLRWHEGVYANEGQHREMIHRLVPDADCIVVVDADEVYSESLINDIDRHFDDLRHYPKRMRLPMWHYWRSFNRGFMHDPALPERLIFPRVMTGRESATWDGNGQTGVIHHFGYAQRSEIVEYKQLTHGHKGEWRKDVDWFKDVFMANRQTDTHPVGSEYWNCEDMDLSQLPSVLKDHPFKDLDVIP